MQVQMPEAFRVPTCLMIKENHTDEVDTEAEAEATAVEVPVEEDKVVEDEHPDQYNITMANRKVIKAHPSYSFTLDEVMNMQLHGILKW